MAVVHAMLECYKINGHYGKGTFYELLLLETTQCFPTGELIYSVETINLRK